MEYLEITHEEYGDITARCDRPMTVANLIEVLRAMPPDATVIRYGWPEDDGWTIESVHYEVPSNRVGLV